MAAGWPTVDEVLTGEMIPTVALPPDVRKVDVVRVEHYRVPGRGKGWRLWLADGAHWNYNPVVRAWQRAWGPSR